MDTREPCPHARGRYIGTDASAHFYQCADCGEVLIRQGSSAWRVRPVTERP